MPGQRRRVFPAITAAAAIPVALLIAAAASAGPAGPDVPGWQPQIVAAAPDGPASAGAASRYVISPSFEQSEAALSRLVAAKAAARTLPPGRGIEQGLQEKTLLVERAVSARFPDITSIGGVRQDSMRWHPEGLAIDVMIPDYDTPAGKALGDRVVAFAFENAEQFGLEHVIWQRTYYPASGRSKLMADLGDDDANHYTHVHIATTGGGYPSDSYLR